MYPQYPVEEEDNLKKEQEFSKIDAIENLQKRLMKWILQGIELMSTV